MWVNCRSRVRLHVYAQHKRRAAYKGRYCGNCSQFILYMRWTGNLYEQQLKYMPAWITSDRWITVLMGKFMWMAKASKSVLNNTVRVNLFLLGHKVLSGCVKWKYEMMMIWNQEKNSVKIQSRIIFYLTFIIWS